MRIILAGKIHFKKLKQTLKVMGESEAVCLCVLCLLFLFQNEQSNWQKYFSKQYVQDTGRSDIE